MFKALGNAIELSTLDDVVKSLLDECDSSINAVVASNISPGLSPRVLSVKDAELVEDEIFSRIHDAYNKRAQEKTGRTLTSLSDGSWLDDGKDNLEVRKRILNRGLVSRRGKIIEALRQDDSFVRAQCETALIQANEKISAFGIGLRVSPFLIVTKFIIVGICDQEKFPLDSIELTETIRANSAIVLTEVKNLAKELRPR